MKHLYLQFFAEGGADGGADGATNSGLSGDFETDFARFVQKSSGAAAVPDRAKNNNANAAAAQQNANAEQAPDAGEQKDAAEQSKDFDKEFDNLINGDYKQAFQKRTQKIINERFKQGKQAEQVRNEYEDALSFVYDKYGVKKGDLTALKSAVESDASLVAEEAARRHLPKEQVLLEKKMAKVQQKEQAERLQQQQQQANTRQWNNWQNQAQELAKTYPGFDLRAEIVNNQDFAGLLDKGLSVRQAYESVHFNEICQAVAKSAVQDAREKTAREIAANGHRPAEGAVGVRPGISVGMNSVENMTGRDIDNILQRVQRGEKITF